MAQVIAIPNTERESGSGWRVLLLAISIALLAVILPAALVFTVDDVGRSIGWVVTVPIAVWAGIRLSFLWVDGIPRLFDFFFWVFTYIFMGISASASMRAGEVPYTTPSIDPALDLPAALIVLAGVLAYELGSFLRWVTKRKPDSATLVDHQVSAWRSTLLYLFGLVTGAYYVSKMGLSVIFSSRTTSAMAQSYIWSDSSTLAIVYALAIYPMLVAVGGFAQLRRAAAKDNPARHLYAVLILIGVGELLLVANPLTSARYTAGTVAFALVMFAGVATTRNGTRLAMVGTIFGFLFVFPLLNVFRNLGGQVTERQSFFSEYIANPDYDAFFQVANAYAFWAGGHVVVMRQLMGSLFFWVPRVLWADKPEDTGIMLADFRNYSFTNLSAPMWAELMVNGGVPVVILGFVILGAALRALDDRMVPAHAQGGWWALVGSILAVYTLILWRGSLLQATGAVVVMMVGLFWVRKKSPPNNVSLDHQR